MKAIIFDLDDTLIDWIYEYNDTLYMALQDYVSNVSFEMVDKVNLGISKYDKEEDNFTKEGLLKYINKYTNLDLPLEYIDKIEKYQFECADYDEDRIDLIKYLSKKYDLYLISNWFTSTQTMRLKKAGILEYFKGVYGADINPFKPKKEAFKVVYDKYGVENCISVGDSLTNDIEPCYELGMKVIWKTNEHSDKYTTIKDIKELRNIL